MVNDRGTSFYERLICWALVEDEDAPGKRYVVGMIEARQGPGMMFADESPRFEYYVYEENPS